MDKTPAMKRFLLLLLFVSDVSVAKPMQEEPDARESVLDRVAHVEDEVIVEVPYAPRWCDRLELTKRRMNVGECELYVELEGEGKPLLLINGGPGGTHHYFHPWFSRAKDYARVVYYDQRGTGLSDYESGENGYSVGQAVEDMETIRESLGFERWVLLGYSYGGFLAQYYTVRYPERVSGLILLGASTGMWVDMKSGRQYEFISDEEKEKMKEFQQKLRALAKEKNWPRQKYVSTIIYNNFINGDWKRQHFYKPTAERFSQIALYEWVHDENFNAIMNTSMNKVDLTGAFEDNPIPTLIVEGKWDLTWNTDKLVLLQKNHPRAKFVMFENAGHGVYDEAPGPFFDTLEDFIRGLPEVTSSAVADYKKDLLEWDETRKASPEYIVRSKDWGRGSNEEVAASYKEEWLDQIRTLSSFLKIGFALYDVERYEEAHRVFQTMEKRASSLDHDEYEAVALIWQGHMLDLLERRDEALTCYEKVAAMELNETWTHSQFGLTYELSPWARQRMKRPFQRIENQEKD
jgi:proline iminopeptidase